MAVTLERGNDENGHHLAIMLKLNLIKSLPCPLGADTMQTLSIKLPDETLQRLNTVSTLKSMENRQNILTTGAKNQSLYAL